VAAAPSGRRTAVWNATVPPMQNPTIAVCSGEKPVSARAVNAASTSVSISVATSVRINGITEETSS